MNKLRAQPGVRSVKLNSRSRAPSSDRHRCDAAEELCDIVEVAEREASQEAEEAPRAIDLPADAVVLAASTAAAAASAAGLATTLVGRSLFWPRLPAGWPRPSHSSTISHGCAGWWRADSEPTPPTPRWPSPRASPTRSRRRRPRWPSICDASGARRRDAVGGGGVATARASAGRARRVPRRHRPSSGARDPVPRARSSGTATAAGWPRPRRGRGRIATANINSAATAAWSPPPRPPVTVEKRSRPRSVAAWLPIATVCCPTAEVLRRLDRVDAVDHRSPRAVHRGASVGRIRDMSRSRSCRSMAVGTRSNRLRQSRIGVAACAG